jgi:uncharacterized protein (TIRG00374 family)
MKQRLTIAFSLILGFLLIGIWISLVDFKEMFRMMRAIRLPLLLPLCLFFVLPYFLRSLRWKILLSSVQNISVSESFHLCMTNYLVNFLIPLHAGEVAKSYLLKKMKQTPISKSLSSVYLDKVMDALPLFLLVFASPLLTKELNHLVYLTTAVLSFLLLVLVGSMSFAVYNRDLALRGVERILFFLPKELKGRLRNFLNLFIEGLSSLSQFSGQLFEVIGLTLLAFLAHAFFLWLFFFSFGIDLPPLTVLVGYLLLNASFILPAPPGFAGTLELSFLFIFSYLYGYDKNLVSAVAAASHVLTAALFGFFGLWSMALIGTKLSTVLKVEANGGAGVEA